MQTYRRNAERCLELAQRFNDRERRLSLLGMANVWLTLAEQHLRNRESAPIHETPTPFNKPPPPPEQPPEPPPVDEHPPPANEPPPQRMDPAGQDEPMES